MTAHPDSLADLRPEPSMQQCLINRLNEVADAVQFDVDTSDGFWATERALTATAEVMSAEEVVVTLWSVVLGASADLGVARVQWQSSMVEMRLIDGQWLMNDWLSKDGPSPAPSNVGVFATPEELGEVMSWPVAPQEWGGKNSSETD